MEERFLHFIWQYQYFAKPLLGTKGEVIEVIIPGELNSDSGPDFSAAKIKVDGMTWAGSVEIHVQASEWFAHNHHTDKTYDNTILHVVWEADREVKRLDGSAIATLSLKNTVDPKYYDNYRMLMRSSESIPCANQIDQIDHITKVSTLDKVLMERIMSKSEIISDLVQNTNGDWEEVTYQLIAKNFGFKVNSDQFFRLSKSVPLKVLTKAKDLPEIEALFFGQAGFLNDNELGFYGEELLKEYEFLAHKYNLSPALSAHQWKFMRMRPANFPTIRMAQLSKLLFEMKHLFSWIIESTNFKDILSKLRVTQSDYWVGHYDFSKSSERQYAGVGKDSAENVVMNTVVPLLVAYGKFVGDQALVDRAIEFLQQIPPEKNKITRMWDSLQWSTKTAFDSQALIELHNSYCQKKRCLSCNVGMRLIKVQK